MSETATDLKEPREVIPESAGVNSGNSVGATAREAEADKPIHDSQVEAFVRSLGGVYYRSEGGYHHIGYPEVFVFDDPLRQIFADRLVTLSLEEERRIYDLEKAVFKLHLQVPPNLRVEVLGALVRRDVLDEGISQSLYNANSRPPTGDEMRAAGAVLVGMGQWKMIRWDSEQARFPDFVFPVHPLNGQDPVEALRLLADGILPVIGDLNLPAQPVPRYSIPVYQERAPYLSFSQGNGDFKDYFIRAHGREELAKFYDPTRNFAVRKGTLGPLL